MIPAFGGSLDWEIWRWFDFAIFSLIFCTAVPVRSKLSPVLSSSLFLGRVASHSRRHAYYQHPFSMSAAMRRTSGNEIVCVRAFVLIPVVAVCLLTLRAAPVLLQRPAGERGPLHVRGHGSLADRADRGCGAPRPRALASLDRARAASTASTATQGRGGVVRGARQAR